MTRQKTATEMCEKFENAYENEALSCMHAFKRLKISKMDTRTLTTIHQLHKIWTQLQQLMNWCVSNYSMTCRLMEDQLHINRPTICHILCHDARKRKICAYCLFYTDKQKDHRVTTCKDLIQICQTNPNFPSGFIAAVESLVFHYQPERKCQGMVQ